MLSPLLRPMVLGARWSRHPLQAAAPAAPSEARLGKVVARSLRDCVSWGGAAQLSPRAGAGATADTRSGRRTEVAASQAPFFYVFPPALASVLPKKKNKEKKSNKSSEAGRILGGDPGETIAHVL